MLNVFRNPILWVILTSILPTVILSIISYFQAIAYTQSNLEGIIKIATTETDHLLTDADAILRRSNTDLQNADNQTIVKILQRQIYNDFRFREAGIINPSGLLTLTNLGIVEPPIPISVARTQFDPNNRDLQVLGTSRSEIMQEQSIALALRGSGQIGGVYLLVDPVVLTQFLEVIPHQDLGTDGFIAFFTGNERLLTSIGASPQDIFSHLDNVSFDSISVARTTEDGNITIVGQVSRRWALRYWLRELLVAAPLTVLISGILSYLFIRQIRRVAALDYELKRGLAHNEFEVHYQPIMDLETRQCIGSEALLRWRHPQRGLLYPNLFIPIAEQTGFIITMTEWLLEKVIQDQSILVGRFPNLYTAINLSPVQLNTGAVNRLVQMLREANNLSENNLSEMMITFEITENKLVEDEAQAVQDAIARLKLWGIRFAVDDFGTGYSNIAYLQRLDIDQLKIDQLFVNRLEHSHSVAQIVDSLIDFGTRIGLTIIAEGIETETQYQYLRARGVRYGQGWLFSRPLPFEDFERFLQTQVP